MSWWRKLLRKLRLLPPEPPPTLSRQQVRHLARVRAKQKARERKS